MGGTGCSNKAQIRRARKGRQERVPALQVGSGTGSQDSEIQEKIPLENLRLPSKLLGTF